MHVSQENSLTYLLSQQQTDLLQMLLSVSIVSCGGVFTLCWDSVFTHAKKDNTYARERSSIPRQNWDPVDYGNTKVACTKTHSKSIKRLQNVEAGHYTEEKERKKSMETNVLTGAVVILLLLLLLLLLIAFIQRYSPLSSRLTALACDSTWVNSFLSRVFEYPPKWCTYSAGMAGATWNCCHLGASSVYTMQPYTMSLHAKPHT